MNFMAANFPHDGDPNTFEQAMLRPDRDNWIKGMQKEYKNMHHKKVWKDIKKSDIVVIYLMNPSWTMISLDVETAFLYGKLDEPLYMDIPPGFIDIGANICSVTLDPQEQYVLELSKTIYGIVQAACAFSHVLNDTCLLYTSPSPRDGATSRMPSSA